MNEAQRISGSWMTQLQDKY